MSKEIKINEKEEKCLRALAEYYDADANCMYFRGVVEQTKLELKEVRRAVRSLARKGLAQFERGLFDDDGQVAGSGYRCTLEGVNFLERLNAEQGKNEN